MCADSSFFLASVLLHMDFDGLDRVSEKKLSPFRDAALVLCARAVRCEMRAAKSNKIFDFRFEVSDGGMDGTQLNPNNYYHTISISMMIHIRARISVQR